MITLYTWNTPNGQKPAILLEELGLSYEISRVDIGAGEQNDSTFRDLNPNGKIPALVDGEVAIFESGAILLHLAQKYEAFLPDAGQERANALAWSFWQVGGLGPMIGQWGHFLSAKEKLPYAIERYLAETLRLFDVLEGQLSANPYLAGEEYTIADIMCFPWAKGGLMYLEGAAADRRPEIPATRRWISKIEARPAVSRAIVRVATPQQEGMT